MIFFINLITNNIFILFSNLLYIIYVANKQNLKEDINEIVLDISILISLFLIIIFNSYYHNNIFILSYTLIILLLSLKYKRVLISFIISIISIEYLHFFFHINYELLTLLFLGNILIYYIFRNSKYKDYLNILYSTVFIILINYKNIIIFYLSSFIIYFLIKKFSNILKLKNLLKEYKKESNLKISLFKITHEIKNPLAVVKGYLSMMNIDNKEKSTKYLSIINSEVERTINLLNDFREFSKIEINITSFKLEDLLEEVKNILISLTENKNILLNFKLEENIILNADYNRIKQVLINVIKNSIEASENNSSIDITCFKNKNLNIIIKDYGSGMDDETLNNLFTPFHTTKEKGTGLGVCLSKEIIEAHKGKINYSSILNKGTIVKIVLPLN